MVQIVPTIPSRIRNILAGAGVATVLVGVGIPDQSPTRVRAAIVVPVPKPRPDCHPARKVHCQRAAYEFGAAELGLLVDIEA